MNGSAIGLMSTKRISVERVSIISRKSLQNVLAKFDAAIDSAECVAPLERMSEGLNPLASRDSKTFITGWRFLGVEIFHSCLGGLSSPARKAAPKIS